MTKTKRGVAMKQLIIILTLLTLLLAACATTEPDTGATGGKTEKETITIAFVGALSGPEAMIGDSGRRGVEMAFAELGETKYNYTFVAEDDVADPTKSVAAYQKLRSINDVDAIIGTYSPQGNALAPLAEEDRVLYCSIASDSGIARGRTYTFLHWVGPEMESRRYTQRVKELGWKYIVALEPNQAGVKAVMDVLEQYLADEGITMERNIFEMDEKDFRTTIARMEGKDVDSVMFILFPGQSLPGLKQLKEAGIDVPLSSIEIWEYYTDEEKEILERDEDWYIFAGDPMPGFRDRYKARYPDSPISMAPNGYDCAKLIIKAFEEGGRDPAQAAAIIHNLKDYEGAVGTLYYENGRIESPAVVKQIVDGEFVVVET